MPPRNQQAEKLALIHLLEEMPAERVAKCLHKRLDTKDPLRYCQGLGPPAALCFLSGVPFLIFAENLGHSPGHTQTARRIQPTQHWQVDYIRPLPLSDGCLYALTRLGTSREPLQAHSSKRATQKTRGLGHLCPVYGGPTDINSHQGTHFTGHQLQTWTYQMDIPWHFHLPYNPMATGLMEQTNSLLRQLTTEDRTLAHRCLASVMSTK